MQLLELWASSRHVMQSGPSAWIDWLHFSRPVHSTCLHRQHMQWFRIFVPLCSLGLMHSIYCCTNGSVQVCVLYDNHCVLLPLVTITQNLSVSISPTVHEWAGLPLYWSLLFHLSFETFLCILSSFMHSHQCGHPLLLSSNWSHADQSDNFLSRGLQLYTWSKLKNDTKLCCWHENNWKKVHRACFILKCQ